MNTRKKIVAAATAVALATGATAAPAQAQPLPAPTSSVNQGQLVAVGTGLLAAVLTIGLIVGSDVRGANKIINAYNRETGNNVPHLQQPFSNVLGH